MRPVWMGVFLAVVFGAIIYFVNAPADSPAGRSPSYHHALGSIAIGVITSLLVTPISYTIFDDWGAGRFFRRRNSKAGADPVPAPGEALGPVAK